MTRKKRKTSPKWCLQYHFLNSIASLFHFLCTKHTYVREKFSEEWMRRVMNLYESWNVYDMPSSWFLNHNPCRFSSGARILYFVWENEKKKRKENFCVCVWVWKRQKLIKHFHVYVFTISNGYSVVKLFTLFGGTRTLIFAEYSVTVISCSESGANEQREERKTKMKKIKKIKNNTKREEERQKKENSNVLSLAC